MDPRLAEPEPTPVIDGYAYEGRVSLLVSESGAGKTFLALSMAAAVSDGVPWLGRSTAPGSVAYCSFEGDALGLRLRALRDAQGRALDRLHVVRPTLTISPRLGRDGDEVPSLGEVQIASALKRLSARLAANGELPIRLVIIDTARASMAGSEDLSDSVAAYLRAVRRIAASVPRAAIIVVHHSGWQDGEAKRKRERGSSAWRGNSDVVLYLEAGEYNRVDGFAPLTLLARKTRDLEPLPDLGLVRRRVILRALAHDGGPLTSCVVEADQRTRDNREAEARAQLAAQHENLDLRTLNMVHKHPEFVTSQKALRMLLAVGDGEARESVQRPVVKGYLLPGGRSKPYTLTQAGYAALTQGTT